MASSCWQTLKTKYLLMVDRYPIANGMIAYAVLWPAACFLQQTINGRNFDNYDYACCLRYSIYGGLFMAPTLYYWIRLTSAMWPEVSLRTAIYKSAVDQVTFAPFACTSFFFGMSLLEGKTIPQAIDEVKKKMFTAYKMGMCFWPFMRLINFTIIPPRNRIVFSSICSFAWTTLLSSMKQEPIKDRNEDMVKQDTK